MHEPANLCNDCDCLLIIDRCLGNLQRSWWLDVVVQHELAQVMLGAVEASMPVNSSPIVNATSKPRDVCVQKRLPALNPSLGGQPALFQRIAVLDDLPHTLEQTGQGDVVDCLDFGAHPHVALIACNPFPGPEKIWASHHVNVSCVFFADRLVVETPW